MTTIRNWLARAGIALALARGRRPRDVQVRRPGRSDLDGPHSLNESFQLNFTGNVYEPLVGRGKKLELVPLLATS